MQQRAIETRRRILEAAVQLFSQKGLNGCSIDELVQQSDANRQRIYAYFGSKQKLFQAALLHVFQKVELFSSRMLSRAEKNPERLTEILLQGFLSVHRRHPELQRLLLWANLEGRDCIGVLDGIRKEQDERLHTVYAEAVSRGLLQNIRFENYLFTLLSVSYFYHSNRLTLAHTFDARIGSAAWFQTLCRELDSCFHGPASRHIPSVTPGGKK